MKVHVSSVLPALYMNKRTLETPQSLHAMSYNDKVNRVYLCNRSDKFEDRTALRDSDVRLARILDKAEQQAIVDKISPCTKLAIEYFKCSFHPGDIVSLPTALFHRSQDTHEPPTDLTEAAFLSAIKLKPVVFEPSGTFFQIVDTRPESKTKVHLSGRSYSQQLVHVRALSCRR